MRIAEKELPFHPTKSKVQASKFVSAFFGHKTSSQPLSKNVSITVSTIHSPFHSFLDIQSSTWYLTHQCCAAACKEEGLHGGQDWSPPENEWKRTVPFIYESVASLPTWICLPRSLRSGSSGHSKLHCTPPTADGSRPFSHNSARHFLREIAGASVSLRLQELLQRAFPGGEFVARHLWSFPLQQEGLPFDVKMSFCVHVCPVFVKSISVGNFCTDDQRYSNYVELRSAIGGSYFENTFVLRSVFWCFCGRYIE